MRTMAIFMLGVAAGLVAAELVAQRNGDLREAAAVAARYRRRKADPDPPTCATDDVEAVLFGHRLGGDDGDH